MVEINGVSIYMGGYLLKTFKLLAEFPKHNWDNVIFVTGREGDGKTEFVKGGSFILDPTITIDRWAYNAEQFEAIVDREDLPDGANIVWDESDELSGHWSTAIVQTLKRKFKRIRKKRLTIWLITPTFFDMNKYFAIFRTRCLFDVYAEPSVDENGTFKPNRGRVRFFNWDNKRKLYIHGYKTWDMYATMPDFIDGFGKVPPNYPINEAELEAKKDEAMKAILNKDNGKPTSQVALRRRELYKWRQWFEANPGKIPKTKDYAWVYGVDDRTIRRDWAELDVFVRENGVQGTFLDTAADELVSKLPPGAPNLNKEERGDDDLR